ncbi:hypothetical protein BJ878DRAFT_480539 [Calycina marina]|uniref:Uncharacterized protein n=1 Tax=Calycina marina TaxID=1763456 RepID=A0A9P8CES1_9HELO|nr:hypothetical protein BJ878DRAFT_480539 [Calycina marina]
MADRPLFDVATDFAGCHIDWDATVSQQSAAQLGRLMILLDADHSGLNKFSGEDDVNFKRVLPEIRRMAEGGGSIVTERRHANVFLKPEPGKRSPKSTVPIFRDKKFVERQSVFRDKSQITIEYSYRLRERDPDLWMFWVYASTAERFKGAYKSIAAKFDMLSADDPKTDVLSLVSRWLSDIDNGRWLLILDNADEIDVFKDTRGGIFKREWHASSIIELYPTVYKWISTSYYTRSKSSIFAQHWIYKRYPG